MKVLTREQDEAMMVFWVAGLAEECNVTSLAARRGREKGGERGGRDEQAVALWVMIPRGNSLASRPLHVMVF